MDIGLLQDTSMSQSRKRKFDEEQERLDTKEKRLEAENLQLQAKEQQIATLPSTDPK